MDSEPTTSLSVESSADLLADVDAAIAIMGLTQVPSEIDLSSFYEYTSRCYARVLSQLPAALRRMTHEQELIFWNRLAVIRQWLESTTIRLRARH
jgi:hypothetical protein